jgi:O-antigen/teichoic acid export membrane protein
VGIVNFIDSIVNYAILFSMMGLSVIGIREVANCKNNKKALTETFSSLLTLNLIATVIVLIILLLATCFVSQLRIHWRLMCIGATKLVLNVFLTEWLFKGLEDFKYITVRSLIVKGLFVCTVFLLVKNANDYDIYYLLMCSVLVINAIINWGYRRKIVIFDVKSIKLKRFYKTFFIIGFYFLLTSMYTTFNVSFLGFVAEETEVGYYTTATKLFYIILSVFTAFSGVMLPRISALYVEGKMKDIERLLLKGFNFLLAFSIPLIVWSIIFAPEIIRIIAGEGYEGAIIPMRIVMPLILIIGIEQILVVQILMPFKADRYILINSIIGAAVGIITNILLVRYYLSIGSSVVWVVSEMTVLTASYIAVRKLFVIKIPYKNIILNFLCGGIFVIVCLLIQDIETRNSFAKLLIAAVSCVVILFIFQVLIFKNILGQGKIKRDNV